MQRPVSLGRYRLLRRIGVGGMAEVFEAKTEGVAGFERRVAVKRVLPWIAEDDELNRMFIEEAKIAGQLSHPNIAQVIDLGRVGDDYFIAMEYVHGRDLRAAFERGRRRRERLPLPMSCFVMMQVCEALDYAHERKDASGTRLGLVHRDVPPQNILLSFDGEVKVIDFGIAKVATRAENTQAGVLKGKRGYMSPEQIRGQRLDRRSDVFSCGIILWELLAGERLFAGDANACTLEKLRDGTRLPARMRSLAVPEALARIVARALAVEKRARYQTALDLHDDLEGFLCARETMFAQKDLADFMRESFPEDLRAPAGSGSFATRMPPPPKLRLRPPVRLPPPPERTARIFPPPPPRRPARVPPPPLSHATRGTGRRRPAPSHVAITRRAVPGLLALDGTITRLVRERIGAGSRVTNLEAFLALQQGARLAEDAARVRKANDQRIRRLDAAREYVGAAERALHQRLMDAFPPERRRAWLARRKREGLIQPRLSSWERTLQQFLEQDRLPSLTMMARWLHPETRLRPDELGAAVRTALRLRRCPLERLFVLGQTRNVLAHRQEYEVDPELELGEAAQILTCYSIGGIEGQIVDISPENLRALEAACLDILRR